MSVGGGGGLGKRSHDSHERNPFEPFLHGDVSLYLNLNIPDYWNANIASWI